MTDASVLWANDRKTHHQKVTLADTLRAATAAARKHPFSLMLDYKKIARGPGNLTFAEYVDFRLYDRELHPDDTGRLRFMGGRPHWPLCYQCSDRKWDATTEDKWISEILLAQIGVPTTRTQAIVGGAKRAYGKLPLLETADGLADFLDSREAPVFAKINGGIGSEGATRIVPLGDGKYDVAGMGIVDIDPLFACLSQSMGAYLLQDELVHHPEMAALCGDRIATIRAISFVVDGEVHTPFTILKMPVGGNVADNFWRKGNLVADIDRETGKIRRAIRGKGPDQEVVTHHPDTGALMPNFHLPHWSEVKRLIRDVGELYAPVKYQSLDIAITNNGPAVVEVNTGSAFNLSQIATGEGFLSDEVIDLFRRAGAKVDTSKL